MIELDENSRLGAEDDCEYCGAPHADWDTDPYMEDIYGDRTMHWICDACYQSHCEDI